MIKDSSTYCCEPRELTLYSSKISAGFPSPAEDDIAAKLDLNDYLIKHPAATFFVRARGDSMKNAGIHENDILIVDRSLKPTDGRIIVLAIDSQLTVKRLKKYSQKRIILCTENPNGKPIEIERDDIYIWGVVTNVIHEV